MRVSRSLFGLLVGGVLAVHVSVAAAPGTTSTAQLPIDAVLGMHVFLKPTMSVLALSPDGRYVAYVVRKEYEDLAPTGTDSLYTTTGMLAYRDRGVIYVTDLEDKTTWRVTEEGHSASTPVWSPDSRRLAYYSDAAGYATVWVWEFRTRRAAPVAPVQALPLDTFSLFWTPDGEHILARLRPESASRAAGTTLSAPVPSSSDGAAVDVYQFSPRASEDQADLTRHDGATQRLAADLAMLTPGTATVRRIARDISARCIWLSPDGARLAFTQPAGYEGLRVYRSVFDLTVVAIATGQSRVVAPGIRLSTYGTGISWSPDSSRLAYVATEVVLRGSSDRVADGQTYVVPADGSQPPRRVTETAHPDLGHAFQGPAWSSDGTRLYAADTTAVWEISLPERRARRLGGAEGKGITHLLTPAAGGRTWSIDRGRAVVVLARDASTKDEGLYAIDVVSGRSRRIWEGPLHVAMHEVLDCDASQSAQTLVCRAETFQHSSNVWVFRDNERPRQITDINPDVDRYQLGTSRLVSWLDPDGNTVSGALLLPPAYKPDTSYPLLVTAYPRRRFSDQLNAFGDRPVVGLMQLFTTRGYAVLCADLPLRGRGPMREIAGAVLPGINKLVETGIADADRIGVLGESGGGYSVMALISQSTRFKAAVEMTGFASLVGLYGSFRGQDSHWAIGWTEDQSFVGGTPWEVRERYVENSPIFYLDRIQTPLLMLHGSLDTSVNPLLAGEIFVGLRRLRKEVVFAQYRDEGHGISGLANRRDLLRRVVAWFDQHLKDDRRMTPPSPSPTAGDADAKR